MTVQEIANKLVSYCREGQWDKCYSELYSPEIISAETPGMGIPEAKGFEALAEKGKKWNANILEFHSQICVYKVTDGKIVEERFFY